MYSVKLADGTELNGLELNGNNYISDEVIEDEIFENNLETATITDKEGNIEEQKDMKLVANRVIDGKSWFILAEKTPKEKEREKIEKRIEAMEKASGAGGQAGERGIAQRLDSLEDRIAELEQKI